MSDLKVDTVISRIFKEKLDQLKRGNQVGMEFYLFFEDGFWLYDGERKLSKEQNYAVMRTVICEFQPLFYAIVSDTNARDPLTYKILYEQLMACIVSPDDKNKTYFQPYDRMPNGKIKLTRRRGCLEGAMFGGIGVSLYQPNPDEMRIPEQRAEFIAAMTEIIQRDKRAYPETTS